MKACKFMHLLGVSLLLAVAVGSVSAIPDPKMSGREIVLASAGTVNLGTKAAVPSDVHFYVIFEIHGNKTVAAYPEHCLVRVWLTNVFDTMMPGYDAIIRKDGGVKLVKFKSKGETGEWMTWCGETVTGKDFIGRALSTYAEIGPEPIPLSYWGEKKDFGPDALRVIIEMNGKSMLPSFPEHNLSTATVGVPFVKAKEGMVAVYWNEAVRTFTAHQLAMHWADGIVKGKGFNNPAVDRIRVNVWNFVAVIHRSYRDLGTSVVEVRNTASASSK